MIINFIMLKIGVFLQETNQGFLTFYFIERDGSQQFTEKYTSTCILQMLEHDDITADQTKTVLCFFSNRSQASCQQGVVTCTPEHTYTVYITLYKRY